MNPERILVLGSNSFSGSHFARLLLDQGCEVVGVSRSPEPDPVFLAHRWPGAAPRFRFCAYDLNHDLAEILHTVAEFQPEYVVNFAAQSMVAQSWEHPEHWFQTNVVATVKLHDGLRHCRHLQKYVHITTPEVYGSTSGWVKEDHPFDPTTPYAVSRAACDMSLKSFERAYGFPVVYTRAANVYGPGQQLYRIVPKTVLSIRQGRKLPLHGGGHSVRSFIFIRDVVAATAAVMRRAPLGQTYHISTRQTIAIRDLVRKICAELGARFEDVVEESGERLGKDQAYLLDSGKIRAELGWRDATDLGQGIAATVAWFDQHAASLAALPATYIHKP